MSHYHDSEDLRIVREFKQLAPNDFKAFVELDGIVGKDDGAIPRKYRVPIGSMSDLPTLTECPLD